METIASIDIFNCKVRLRSVFNQLCKDLGWVKGDYVSHLEAFGVVDIELNRYRSVGANNKPLLEP